MIFIKEKRSFIPLHSLESLSIPGEQVTEVFCGEFSEVMFLKGDTEAIDAAKGNDMLSIEVG